MKITQEVLETFRFVCPACRGKLVLQEGLRRIKCVACRRVYPIDEAGIPNMIAEEAAIEDEETAPAT